METLADDLHRVRPLTDEACALWVDEILGIEREAARAGELLRSPNSMHRYGLVLDGSRGLRPIVDALVEETVSSVSERLFPEFGAVRAHHAFVVHYAEDRDRSLGFHVDDSDVTLNLCLGTLFEGGDLLFSGRRCERHRQGPSPDSERRRVAHVPGAAILHAGADRHEALPLEGGRRLNLIVWCKSIHASGGLHPTWCPS